MKFLLIWFSSAILLGALAFMLDSGADMVRLRMHSASTAGEVLAIDRSNHKATIIGYWALGVRYQRTFPQRSGFRVGSRVSVFYDPEDPRRATTENPVDGLWPLVIRSFLGGAFLSIWVALAARFPRWRLFRPMVPFPITPRVLSAAVLLGIAVGTASSLFSGNAALRLWIFLGLALCGGCLLTVQAFRIPNDAGWRAFAKSRLFLPAVVLLVVAQAVESF
jgi:hypothetical protein